MPRFSSQRTRQALLSMGISLDPDLLPENLELFDQDGNPIDANKPPVPPGGVTGQVLTKSGDLDFEAGWADLPVSLPTGGTTGQALVKNSDNDFDASWKDLGPAPGTMVWRGVWDSGVSYSVNDVVVYDDGDGNKTYIFTDDVAATVSGPPDDPLPDFDGNPITTFFDPGNSNFEVTIDDTSLRSNILKDADTPYVAIAFHKTTSGQLEIRTAPSDGVYRDMFANFYYLNSGTWQYKTQNDDSAGNGHPRILGSYTAGYYLLAFMTYNGGASGASTQYGTSRIFLGPNNAATFQAFNFGGPVEFPLAKVLWIG